MIAVHVPKLSFCNMARWQPEGLKHVAIKIRITKYIFVYEGNW
jgi:hypothetical protein